MPSEVVDRANRTQWEEKGSKDIIKRAKEQAQILLGKAKSRRPVAEGIEKELNKTMLTELKRFGINKIP
jgi:trimethylamine:corrinoid methyltransferase-like protein